LTSDARLALRATGEHLDCHPVRCRPGRAEGPIGDNVSASASPTGERV
jgi:hypothetical protein